MQGIAARRFSANGKKYAKGDPVEFPADQFATFEALGLVEPEQPDPEIADEQ